MEPRLEVGCGKGVMNTLRWYARKLLKLFRRFISVMREEGPSAAVVATGRYLRTRRNRSMNRRYGPWLRRRLRKRRRPAPGSGPLFSVVVPVFNPRRSHLAACINSVRNQTYRHWELILVDDGSKPSVQRQVRWAERRGPRIRSILLPANSGIAGATGAGLEAASGDYVTFLDHDDLLTPDALALAAQCVIDDPEIDLLYGDEDKIDRRGRPVQPWFRPDRNVDLLWAYNSLAHPIAVRTALLRSIGGLRDGFDGAQDYDLALRLVDAGARISHLPEVVYHWRISSSSTAGTSEAKPHTWDAGLRALAESVDRRQVRAATRHGLVPNHYEVVFDPRPEVTVAVVVFTTRRPDKVLRSIRHLVDPVGPAPKVTVTVVRPRLSARTGRSLSGWPSEWSGVDGRVVEYVGWPSTAAALNFAVSETPPADLLLFVADDVTAHGPEVLNQLVGSVLRPGVGVAGSAEIDRDMDVLQAGIHIEDGEPAYTFSGLSRDELVDHDLARVTRETFAVSGSMMATTWAAFVGVGGFSERLPSTYYDIGYCLDVRERLGLRVVLDPTFPVMRKRPGALERDTSEVSDYESLAFRDLLRRAGVGDHDPFLPHGDLRKARRELAAPQRPASSWYSPK